MSPRRLTALALAAALAAAPLAACSSLAQLAPQSIADAEKALTLAHLAYDGAGTALQNATQSGALHGADAATAKALYDQAGQALDTADQADAVANARGVFAALAQASALLTQIHTLLSKK